MRIDYATPTFHLDPGGINHWSYGDPFDYSTLQWPEDHYLPKPDQETLALLSVELYYQKEVDAWKAQRQAAYPLTGEQFDQIFHQGLDAWKETIQGIKNQIPKVAFNQAELDRRKAEVLIFLQQS